MSDRQARRRSVPSRSIVFDGTASSNDRFNVLYNAFVLNPRCHVARPFETLRLEASMLAKLEAISRPADEPVMPHGPVLRHLSGPAQVAFTQAEAALLLEYIQAVPWTPVFARHVIAIVDALQPTSQEQRDA